MGTRGVTAATQSTQRFPDAESLQWKDGTFAQAAEMLRGTLTPSLCPRKGERAKGPGENSPKENVAP